MKGSTAEPCLAQLHDGSRPSVSINILSSDADFDYSLSVQPAGQSRTFTIRGRISAPSHPIDGKPGTITIREDNTRAESWRIDRGACGGLILFKEDQLDFGDAFRALLVKSNVADTIERALPSAQIGGRMLSIELDVALEGLPDDRKYYLSNGDLDLTDERAGDVLGLKLWPWSWKPGEIAHWYLREPAIELHLSLTEGSWWGILPWGADMLSFGGVIDSSQLPELTGLPCKLNLREYQVGLGGRYPSTGEFSLQYSFPDICLFYRASDLNTRLKSLLRFPKARLIMRVAIDKSKLLAKLASIDADDVTGRITYCAMVAEARIGPDTSRGIGG